MFKIDGLDQNDEIDKYMGVADEIERAETDIIFGLKFKVVN